MRKTGPDMQKTSPWLIAARVIFTFALIACIVFIFSNSMQIGDVSESASGRVLLLMKKVFTRLGMPGVANHLTDHIDPGRSAHGPDGRDHPDVQRWPEQPAHRRLAGFFGRDGRYSGGVNLSGPVQDVLAALQTSKRGLTQ